MHKAKGGWATIWLAFTALITACVPFDEPAPVAMSATASQLDRIAEDYVRLSLEIGTKEPGYIDAYYGSTKWKAEAESNPRGLVDLANAVIALEERLDLVDESLLGALEQKRRAFLLAQLTAARTRLLMLQGEKLSFRDEALGLFGVVPDLKPLSYYDPILARLEKRFPGTGSLASRIAAIPARHTLSPDTLEPVFNAAIAECRKRTMRHIPLPENERFTMAFVTDKPWSGYNYYQGDFSSKIEINIDFPIRVGRAVDLGCHEGYPGHHVYNVLIEHNLSRQRGWVEYQIYPLYSPQSLIAEGSANYGIELAFPGEERLAYEKSVLYPLAGLDPETADEMSQLQEVVQDLSSVRFTIAQRYLDEEINREEAIVLTQKYMLFSRRRAEQSIGFADTYRSYIINYGLGLDMVRDYVESAGQDPAMRWAAMAKILSEPTLPVDLISGN
ncbi:MAG: hypothetical protein AAGH53_13685 [Pseudomonadota bacterium]